MHSLRQLTIKSCRRWFSSAPPSTRNILEHLKERALLKISGPSLVDYLQGIITNDVRHLQQGSGCMYTHFLNTKGRVLYDSIVYRIASETASESDEIDTVYIECDVQAVESLQKHLKMYRVKRKIDISSLGNEMKVYAVYNPDEVAKSEKALSDSNVTNGSVVPCTSLKITSPPTFCRTYEGLSIFQDPRVADLGMRILAPDNLKPEAICEKLKVDLSSPKDHSFRWLRYNLGVGEGVVDLPPGNCFPLEANCDYMHGVSFHKGCYIGQELTARTHHTGVIRKRLMPLYFSKTCSQSPKDNTIETDGNNLGKLRGIEGEVGLGLLRVTKALDIGNISVGDGVAQTKKPTWWPLELPKERIAHLQKT